MDTLDLMNGPDDEEPTGIPPETNLHGAGKPGTCRRFLDWEWGIKAEGIRAKIRELENEQVEDSSDDGS